MLEGIHLFTDIGHLSPEAQDAIRWCARAGLIRGVGDARFDPDKPLTRWQEALLTYRGVNYVRLAVQQYRPSTVSLFNTNTLRTGAGFFLNSLGDILTNKHVLIGSNDTHPYAWTQYIRADWGLIRSWWEEPEPSVIWDEHDPTDLAVIRLHPVHRAKLPNPVPLVPLDDDEPQEGEPCIAIGSPLSYTNWVSSGVVALYPIVRDDGVPWIGVTAGINPGNSGGPVLALDQRVLGVATLKPWYNSGTWGMAHGDDMGLVLPASEIRRWCQKRGIPVGL